MLLDEARLTLNPRYCWVDAWAFQRLLGRAEEATQSDEADQQPRLAEQALRLYRGGFLPADTDEPWAAPLRERLRSLFMRRVLPVVRQLRQSGNTERAIAYYARGVEADPLAEVFYQGLMRCYLGEGRLAGGSGRLPAAAADTFRDPRRDALGRIRSAAPIAFGTIGRVMGVNSRPVPVH